MKFIRLDRAVGPPASLARVGETLSEDAPSVRFIKLFCGQYHKRFGSHYTLRGGEDRRHAKRLTDAHELELLEEMVRLFVSMDGYGQPSIRNFYARSNELLVSARERISDRAKDAVERESMTSEDRQEYTIKEIADASFYDTTTDEQREEAKRLVASWPKAKLYARHTQEVVRAAMTDKQWKKHVTAREEYEAKRWQ